MTILVTGGASGIGLATAEALLAQGWRTIVADVDRTKLEQCRGLLQTFGDMVRFEQMNVADEEGIIRSIANCEDEFGPITGVVNSAAIATNVPALDTSAELFRDILEINLIGSFVVSREVAKRMQVRGKGSIVNIASVSGILGNRGRVAYGSSKAGVITMTKIMGVEFAPLGIRVNAIAPGPIETPMVRQMHSADARAFFASSIPQGRYGAPSDFAEAALFLLDERKSGFITGQTVCVDGGLSIAG